MAAPTSPPHVRAANTAPRMLYDTPRRCSLSVGSAGPNSPTTRPSTRKPVRHDVVCAFMCTLFGLAAIPRLRLRPPIPITPMAVRCARPDSRVRGVRPVDAWPCPCERGGPTFA